MKIRTRVLAHLLILPLALAWFLPLLGCEVDSYLDPSRTGRFHHTPTVIPILERIDVIEQEESAWGETTGVLPEDLLPNDLTYILSPGDFITVEIFQAMAAGEWRAHSRRIDANGNFRIPEIGDLPAAGKTAQEFEDLIVDRLRDLVVDPRANVVVEEGAAYTYTVDGFVANPGMFTIRRPDLRLSDALASIGGVPRTARTVYVVRQVPLTEDVRPTYERDREPPQRERPSQPAPRQDAPVDIEDLIEQLEDEPRPGPRPGMFGSLESGLVDIDELQPVRVSDQPAVDLDEVRAPRQDLEQPLDETFIYDQERGEWVRTRVAGEATGERRRDDRQRRPGGELVLERVIEIPYERLRTGDSGYNLVVRPRDRIYVEGPDSGVVYVSGEVARPGVYSMPQDGTRLTLSRLVVAAGDLGAVAIPERVDLTRMVGPNREATLRLDLAAIRRRTDPDVYIKPNDHVIIGTSFLATPLAVIRNGFRATYGFGFLLDRNFGNDVFGAPPVNRLN